jgi:spore maturation protein CgeB
MRVYVVHPGASWATSDVFTGVCAGLRAHGIDVYEGRVDTILNWYDAALAAGVQTGMFDLTKLKTGMFNKQRMASAHITQHILDVWPDLVIVVSGHNYHTRDVQALKRVGLRVACVLTEAPYFIDLELILAQIYDTVFTNERRCVARFRAIPNVQAHYLPHAYNSAVHQPGPADPGKTCDAFFVGSWFEERRKLLLGADWTGLNFVWKGHDMGETPHDIVPNEEAVAWYRSAAISLNMHRTTTSNGSGSHIKPEEAESLNPRAYEIAACGAFQLMDDSRAEAKDVFGESLVTYRAGDSADLERQVRKWMRAGEREQYAAAQHAAIQPHSWTARAAQILEVLT